MRNCSRGRVQQVLICLVLVGLLVLLYHVASTCDKYRQQQAYLYRQNKSELRIIASRQQRVYNGPVGPTLAGIKIKVYNLSAPLEKHEEMNCPKVRLPQQYWKSERPQYYICIHDLKKDEFVSGLIKRRGHWEGDISALLIRYMQGRQSTLIDIGANIGAHTMYAAALGYHVVAIEPSPENWPHIQKAAQLNGLVDNITLLPYALSDQRSTVKMGKNPTNLGHTFIVLDNRTYPQHWTYSITAQTLMLDDLIPLVRTPHAVIKIDVESFECHVIRGGALFLRQINVDLIVAEYAAINNVEQACVQDMYKILHGFGYVAFHMTNLSKRVLLGKETPGNIAWIKQQSTSSGETALSSTTAFAR